VTDQAPSARQSTGFLSTIVSAAGVIVAFVVGILAFADLDNGAVKALHGFDSFLGVPSVAGSLIFFAAALTWSVGRFAGAQYPHGLSVAAIVVAALGTIYQLLAVILNLSWYSVVLVLLAIGILLLAIVDCRAARRDSVRAAVATSDRPRVLGVFLILAGLAGLTAAYSLSVDKVTAIISPTTALNCDRSLLVQCSKNLDSWQGSLFGFPNPLIGLGGFVVPLLIGVGLLAGIRFGRWFWVAFNIGVIGAIAFVIFLISQSVFVIGTLCLWCALVWTFTIPLFWVVTLYNLKSGNLRVAPRATRFFGGAYTWVPLITLVCYLIVVLLYQVRLDALSFL
jgi:uncharacterized membrane protein